MLEIPAEYKSNGRTYIYQEQVNEYHCRYRESRIGWNECFLIQDLIKIQGPKASKPFHKDKEGRRKYDA